MSDLIKREDAIEAIDTMICDNKWVCEYRINSLPTAEPKEELISKKDALEELNIIRNTQIGSWFDFYDEAFKAIEALPTLYKGE